MQEMIQDVCNGKIDVIVCYKGDRLARDKKDFFDLEVFLKIYDVELYSITENWDTSTASGELARNMTVVFGDYERKLISERTTHKLEERARRGLYNGGTTPLGYERKNRQLVVLPEDAKIVEFIFDSFINGKTLWQITKKLMLDGRNGVVERSYFEGFLVSADEIFEALVTQKIILSSGEITTNRVLWQENLLNMNIDETRAVKRVVEKNKIVKPSRIKYLLQNVTYIGKITFKGEIMNGIHEAIIDEDVFVEAQKFKKVSNKKRKIYKNLIFGGLVKCRTCGSTMTKTFSNKYTAKGLRRYFYYRCTRTRRFYLPECPVRQVSCTRLTGEIITSLERIVCDEMYLRNFVLGLNFEAVKQPEKFEIFQDMISIKNIDVNLVTGLELGDVEKNGGNFEKNVKKLISRLSAYKLSETENFFKENLIKNLFENVIKLCENKNQKYANLKVCKFVEKIVYDPEFIEIEFKYPVFLEVNGNRARVASAASRRSEAGNAGLTNEDDNLGADSRYVFERNRDESFRGEGEKTAKRRKGKGEKFEVANSENSGNSGNSEKIWFPQNNSSNDEQHVSASHADRAKLMNEENRCSEAPTEESIINNNIAETSSSSEFPNSQAQFQEAKVRSLQNSETPNEQSLREFKEAMGSQPMDSSRGRFTTIDRNKQDSKQSVNNNTNNSLSPYHTIKTYKEVSWRGLRNQVA
ncbi:MAG: recombinase family protein [bacterium]|nr:recombinase family protein [bacterium]